MPKSIYVCLENTLKAGVAEQAKHYLERHLPDFYATAKITVEVKDVESYTPQEFENVPMTILRRAAEDTIRHKTAIGARIVPLQMTSRVTWQIEVPHTVLFIATAANDGTGYWVGTPTTLDHEVVSSYRPVLEKLGAADKEIRTHVTPGAEAARLVGALVAVLQSQISIYKD